MKTRIIPLSLILVAGAGTAVAEEAPPVPSYLPTVQTAAKQPVQPVVYPLVDGGGSPYWPGGAGNSASVPVKAVLLAPKPTDDDCGKNSLADRPACALPADNPHWPRTWFTAECLLWWTKDAPTPALVETTPGRFANVSPLPTSTVIFGGSNVDLGERSGARFSAGGWLDCHESLGVDASFFFLEHRAAHFSASSTGDPALGRPVFDVTAHQPLLVLDASPNFSTGSVEVSLPSRLWGAEANVRTRVSSCFSDHLVLLAGFRHLQLDEGLIINEQTTVLPTVPTIGGISVFDQDTFGTHNQFYGGQVGAEAKFTYGRWQLDVLSKLALGGVHETVRINGFTTETMPNGTITNFPGGLLALPSNIGRYSHNDFAVVPEVTLNLGYKVGDYLRLFVGYNYLYISDVARPGKEIDQSVNLSQVPLTGRGPFSGAARPAFSFRDSEFWAQGLNFGVELSY